MIDKQTNPKIFDFILSSLARGSALVANLSKPNLYDCYSVMENFSLWFESTLKKVPDRYSPFF